jgi:hypothetical protein
MRIYNPWPYGSQGAVDSVLGVALRAFFTGGRQHDDSEVRSVSAGASVSGATDMMRAARA